MSSSFSSHHRRGSPRCDVHLGHYLKVSETVTADHGVWLGEMRRELVGKGLGMAMILKSISQPANDEGD